MTRKDYETLVKFIKNLPPDGRYTKEFVMDRLAGELAVDNSNFNYDRFVEGCGLKSSKPKKVR